MPMSRLRGWLLLGGFIAANVGISLSGAYSEWKYGVLGKIFGSQGERVAYVMPTRIPQIQDTPYAPIIAPTGMITGECYVDKTAGEVYVVQPGDTLWEISRKSGVTVDQLVGWNCIENPNLIHVGQELVVSAPASGNAIPENPVITPQQDSDCLSVWATADEDLLLTVPEIQKYLRPENYKYVVGVTLESAIYADVNCDGVGELVLSLFAVTEDPMNGNTYLIALDENYNELARQQLIFTGKTQLYVKDLTYDQKPELLVLGKVTDGGNHPHTMLYVLDSSLNKFGNQSPIYAYGDIQLGDLNGDGRPELYISKALDRDDVPYWLSSVWEHSTWVWDGSQFVQDPASVRVVNYAKVQDELDRIGRDRIIATVTDESLTADAKIEFLRGLASSTDDEFIRAMILMSAYGQYFVDDNDLQDDGVAEVKSFDKSVKEAIYGTRQPDPALRYMVDVFARFSHIPLNPAEVDIVALAGEDILYSESDGNPESESLSRIGSSRLYSSDPVVARALTELHNQFEEYPDRASEIITQYIQETVGVDLNSGAGLDNVTIDFGEVEDVIHRLDEAGVNIGRAVGSTEIRAGIDEAFSSISDLFSAGK